MYHIRSIVVFLVVGLLLASCSQTAVPKEGEESPRLEATALAPYYTVHSAYGGFNYKNLISTNEGVCWLSGIGGRFNSANDYVNVNHNQGQWYFSLSSSSANTNGWLWGQAHCVKWSAFKTPGLSQPSKMLSNQFLSKATSCTSYTTKTWWGDAATYISQISGDLTGISGVYIGQSTKGNESSSLITSKCGNAASNMYGGAHSVFVGKAHSGDMPQFWGPKGVGVPYSSAGNYRAVSWGPTSVDMAEADKAFCYLSYVWGDFDTDADNDYAWIYQTTNSAGKKIWRLSVNDSNATNGQGIGAYANCYMLTQY
jgi:hypothetical protein